MNAPPILPVTPPVPAADDSLTYELTRWDLFLNSMTVLFRNRLLQIFVVVAIVIKGAAMILPQIGKASPLQLLLTAVGLVAGVMLTLLIVQGVMAVVIAYFKKQTGVVCKHTLLVTSTGLIERTDVNETLHKWPSILRIMSLFGYIYIYVGEYNSHQIPRDRISPQALETFLTNVRAHCPHLKR